MPGNREQLKEYISNKRRLWRGMNRNDELHQSYEKQRMNFEESGVKNAKKILKLEN